MTEYNTFGVRLHAGGRDAEYYIRKIILFQICNGKPLFQELDFWMYRTVGHVKQNHLKETRPFQDIKSN
jgi:hypothetical protein